VPLNVVEAVKCYRDAALQGHVVAQYNLALCYEHGRGVACDPNEAVRLYRAAAEQGYYVARRVLGRFGK
jgi:TPR repeat protein